MKKIVEYFKSIYNIKCSHSTACSENCKFCPDCGQRVVYRWIVIKCGRCGHYRQPVFNWLKEIKPSSKYCFFCGSDKWTVENYFQTNIPDGLKSIAMKKFEPQQERRFGSLTGKTKVWVSVPLEDQKLNRYEYTKKN